MHAGSQAQGPEKLSIEIRDKIMGEFRRGETKVLICTDVLSRGIDVPQVTLVINFDLPIYYHTNPSHRRGWSGGPPRGGGPPYEGPRRGFYGGGGVNQDKSFNNNNAFSATSTTWGDSWEAPQDNQQTGGVGGPQGGGPEGLGVKGDDLGVCVNFETYLHRIGRTGRFGLKGIAVNLIAAEELCLLEQIKSFYGCEIKELPGDSEVIESIIRKLRTGES